MTHDELLAKIQSEYEENKHFRDEPKWKPFAALRAVVELHRPMPLVDDCYGCRQADPYLNKVYPCETIEAIEKELA